MRLAGDAELDVGAIKKIFQEPPIIAEKDYCSQPISCRFS